MTSCELLPSLVGSLPDDKAASLAEFTIDSMEVPRSFGFDDNDAGNWLQRLNHSKFAGEKCYWNATSAKLRSLRECKRAHS
jgi:hypothetical protein